MGEEEYFYSFYGEWRDADPMMDVGMVRTVGFAYEHHLVHQRERTYYGFSASKISADRAISEFGDPYTIYPLYSYWGIMLNSDVSPFIEIGIDVIDAIVDNPDENNSSTVDGTTDNYLAGGLKLRVHKDMMLSFYVKEYVIRPYVLPPTHLYVGGVSLALRFE